MSKPTEIKRTKAAVREARKKMLARILALVMALLMVGGSAYYLVYMLIFSASAENGFASDMLAEDLNIRVGLKYGDGAPDSFATTTISGYTVGIQPLSDGVFDYTPFWHLDVPAVTVSSADNLARNGSDYVPASGTSGAAVGGYHVEFVTDYPIQNMMLIEQQVSVLNNALFGSGFYAFPAYVGGVLRIRAGAFATPEEAAAAYPVISAILPGIPAQIASPSATGVVVLDPSSDRILFAYDDGGITALGLSAMSTGFESVYMKTSVGNVYDGVFAYSRYRDETVDGIAVTNVLTLDQYVEGVLPYEISNTWPLETQKAFAIAARSYAASCLRRHESAHGFDLCNAAHCQAYHGAARVNETVKEAARSTHGLIITHNGKIASTYYSSSFGGHTVGIGDVWGGASYDYLTAHATPWERYTQHNNGLWTAEVSPKELLDYLVNTKGHTELAGGGYIARIEVLEYAAGSPYVKMLKLTAANGRSVTLKNTDGVRLGLGKYLKSANFVVAQGSVQYTEETVEILGDRVIDAAVVQNVLGPVSSVSGGKTSEGFISVSDAVSVLTAGTGIPSTLAGSPVLTASGVVSVDSPSVLVLTAGNSAAFAAGNLEAPKKDAIALPRTVKEYTVHTEIKTANASSAQNFIFVGKGWGHGAGLSQYGAMDLGVLGYDYSQIIHAYYTDVSIVFYKELDQFKNR